MRSVAVLDGVLVPSDRATIPISDRGFLYGDAVFEILRTYDGALPFAAEHVERAVAAARTLGITDEHTSAESLLHALDAAVRGASLAPGEDAVLPCRSASRSPAARRAAPRAGGARPAAAPR